MESAIGYGGHGLLVAVAAVVMARKQIRAARFRTVLALMAVMLAAIPVGALPAIASLRGVFGDLSITTLVLLSLALIADLSGRAWLSESERSELFAVLALCALLFYPLALGVGMFDPYAAGYGSVPMLCVLAIAFIAAWWLRRPWIAAMIILATAGWVGGILESTNLWDYLMDPLVAVFACGSSLWRLSARWRGGVQTR